MDGRGDGWRGEAERPNGEAGEIDGGVRLKAPMGRLVERVRPMRRRGVSLVRAWGLRRKT